MGTSSVMHIHSEDQHQTASDATIEAIERYAPDIDIPPPAILDQARRNLQARVAMLREFGASEPSEIANLIGSEAKNPANVTDNWRRAHKVVAVKWRGRTLVPGFMLVADGTPNLLLRPVLTQFHEYGMTDWQAALWWMISNPKLEGMRPVDVLLRDQQGSGEALIEAAHRDREWF